jgi:hypothetical protein
MAGRQYYTVSLARLLVCSICIVCVARAELSVTAHVRDGETGRPLSGVMVMSEGSDIMAVTDSAGQSMVVSLPRRGGYLLVSRAGYFSLRQAWKPPAKPVSDVEEIELLLYPDRPRVVVGRVFDAGTKLAISEALVSVVGVELAETTRADGGFTFSRFPPGPQTLVASSPGYPRKALAIQVEGGETSSVDLYLLDTTNVGRLDGTVYDARTGAPVRDARVAVDGTGCVTMTDSAGRYAIENIPVGMNKVLVSGVGYVNAYTVVRLVKDWSVTADLYLRDTLPPPARRR